MTSYKPDMSLISRLLIKLDSRFFSYSVTEQNRYRQYFLDNEYDRVNAYLYNALFDLEYDSETDDDPLSSDQNHLLNAYTTALVGIGGNAFRLCELQGTEFDLTVFDSLYEMDEAEYEYQEEARTKYYPSSYQKRDYRLYLNHNWVRMLDNERNFYYSTHFSLSGYLTDEIESTANGLIEALIPHKLVEGPDHGKDIDGDTLWDLQYQANGMEPQLEALKSSASRYRQNAREQLDNEFHTSSGVAVYFHRYSDDTRGPCWDVIVKNSETAKKISFSRFLSDCQKYLQPFENLDTLKEREKEKVEHFINQAHKDILENANPKVTILKNEMKIVVATEALDNPTHLPCEDGESR